VRQSAQQNSALASAASQESAAASAITLKGLAHASRPTCQEAIGTITKDLAHVFYGLSPSARQGGETVAAQAATSRLVNAGMELQRRSDNFADQSQAKTWGLRALCWLSSVVTFPLLGLSKLIAPGSDFADSLSRYLLGNDVTNGDQLEKFHQLFAKLNELHDLAMQNPDLGEKFQHGTAGPEATAVRGEISQLLLELGSQEKVPERAMKNFMLENLRETFQGRRIDENGTYIPYTDKHFQLDFSEITDEIFSQKDPQFPSNCFFERDLFRGEFTLTIGGESLEIPEKERDTDTFKKTVRKFVLDQITKLAEDNHLDRVAVLKNFLKTYTGQAATGAMTETVQNSMLNANDSGSYFTMGFGDHIPAYISIGVDGSCAVSHHLTHDTILYVDGQRDCSFHVPCHVEMAFTYAKSLNDALPHPVEDRCRCSGSYLDVIGMAREEQAQTPPYSRAGNGGNDGNDLPGE